MGQSGRVGHGDQGGGERRVGTSRDCDAHRSPVALSVPAPETRARPGAAPQPRGLCCAAALVRVHAGPRGSQRPAAQPGCAAGYGAAHRHPPAGLHLHAHLHPTLGPGIAGAQVDACSLGLGCVRKPGL
jgi:hypothetical protein